MPKLKITVGNFVTYEDSSGREYKGPLRDAPPYVKKAVEDMNKLLQSIDDTFSGLLSGTERFSVAQKSYKMTIGKTSDWTPVIGAIAIVLALVAWALFKLLSGE